MYLVTIKNGDTSIEIHNEQHKLFSGTIVKGINTIDSFTFTMLPNNPGFGVLKEFTTLVEVYNTNRKRYEFRGRVLCSSPSMNESGLITLEATCESILGYLCDSQQSYVAETNWNVSGLLNHILQEHNSQVEPCKVIQLGDIIDIASTASVKIDIQRESTWETIKKKIIEKVGGEIRIREQNGVNYLDLVYELGETKTTAIALSHNMKSITKEKDPSAFITRLIPLGAKLGDDSEERLDITSVNDGKNYIEDAEAVAEYGIHVGDVEFDDVTEPSNLLSKGKTWLRDNNKVAVKYSITALDLSLIGLDIDDFEVANSHPIKNALLGIDDVARIIKKTIDVCDETKTTIEIGESFKTLSEIQREQVQSIGKVNANITEIIRNYVTNERLTSEITKTVSLIEQQEESIILSVSAGTITRDDYDTFEEAASAAFALKVGKDDNDQIVSMLNASADKISLKSNKLVIECDDFTLKDGRITATDATLSGTLTSSNDTGELIVTGNSITLTDYDQAGDQVVRVDGMGVSINHPITVGGKTNSSFLNIKRSGSILQDGVARGIFQLSTDGFLDLKALALRITLANGNPATIVLSSDGFVRWQE